MAILMQTALGARVVFSDRTRQEFRSVLDATLWLRLNTVRFVEA